MYGHGSRPLDYGVIISTYSFALNCAERPLWADAIVKWTQKDIRNVCSDNCIGLTLVACLGWVPVGLAAPSQTLRKQVEESLVRANLHLHTDVLLTQGRLLLWTLMAYTQN